MGVLRDNKAILNKIEKNTNLPQFCDMVYYGKTLTYIYIKSWHM